MKTFKPIISVFIFASCLLLTGCSDTIRAYHSSGIYMPLFQKSNQVQADGEIGFYSYQGRAAYSITNHFAVFGDYYCRSPLLAGPDLYKEWNAGGEYFKQIKDNVTFETLVGYGTGSAAIPYVNRNYLDDLGFFKKFVVSPYYSLYSNYHQFMVQPNIGVHKGKITFGAGLRLSLLDFNKYDEKEKENPPFYRDTIKTYALNSNPIFLIEPGVFMSKRFLSVNKFSADWYINAGGAMPVEPKEPIPFWSVFVRVGIKMKLN